MSNIEEYTKNFKFMIPEFNVATWHTEVNENFKAIDALIANFVQSQQYKGAWKKVTQYEISDLVYISDEDSDYYGFLMRVKVNHITTGDDFDTFLANNPTYYEVQGEMGAQVAALRAQDWAEKTDGKVVINEVPIDYSSKAYAIGGTGTETNNSKYFKEQAELARDGILLDPGFIAVKNDMLGDGNINIVATYIANVNSIGDNILSILSVYNNLSDINTCSSNINAILNAPTQATNAQNSATSAAQSAALAYQYGNDKINQTHITNCVTHIPQDLKLELNNGTLTLKAGSKVYVPNGTGMFDTRIVQNDLTWTLNGSNTMSFIKPDGSRDTLLREYCYSGATAPTSFQGGLYAIWYDTTNNIVKKTNDGGSTWTTGYSLPAFITNTDNSYQVFNGFGYIGQALFLLSGVKALLPDGRNIDGTLKNLEFLTTAVTVWDIGSFTFPITLFIRGVNDGRSMEYFVSSTIYIQDEEPTKTTYIIWYSPSENKWRAILNDVAGGWLEWNVTPIATFITTSGVFSDYKTKTVFRALDYNDFNTLFNQRVVPVSALPANPIADTVYLIPE